jgi:hypothetical protein
LAKHVPELAGILMNNINNTCDNNVYIESLELLSSINPKMTMSVYYAAKREYAREPITWYRYLLCLATSTKLGFQEYESSFELHS